MSSSVFFKFKSQKEPSRVTFDGTGISVFELKRQIIQINRLGDGSDFDLAIYNQDTNEEYDDDTTIIPRSTSIIARRLPPTKPGRGTAQRYVSGKMPTNALPNAGRREKNFGTTAQPAKKPDSPGRSSAPAPTGGESEEDMIAAMFQAQSEQWNKTQEQLAAATPVYRGGNQGFKKNAAPAPSHPPPAGYVCYRCGEKGHWIQQCPTNADPNYDGRPRIKRTTGIPRSFLKTVEKPIPQANDDPTLNQSNPTSVMVNADGEYVVAVADQASWESYQKKASGVANKAEAPKGSKELQERGIECDMCHKLMRDAVKTPCCKKVNCEECIQNALLESDFVCPTCEAKEILLDSLVADADTRNKIVEYKKEKEAGTAPAPPNKDQQQQQKPISPPVAPPAAPAAMRAAASASQRSPSVSKSATTTPIPSTANMVPATTAAKKRPAEDEIGPEVPRGPAAMRNQQMQQQQQQFYPAPVAAQNPMYNAAAFQQQYPNHGQQAYGYGGMGMGGGFNGGYNNYGFQGNGFQHQQGYFQGGGYGYNPNAGFMPQQGFNKFPMNAGMGMGMGYNAAAAFQNQQKTVFSEPFPSEEDSPYMRKPVNPHRHMRGKRIRPSDYKAVGGEMMGGEMM